MTGSSWRTARGPPWSRYSSARNSLRSRTLPLNARRAPGWPPPAAGASPAAVPPVTAGWQQRAVLLHRRAAARRVDHDRVHARPARTWRWCAGRTRPPPTARPECSDSAPQQPWPAGMITSQPSAASTRAVAALTSGKKTCCTQPVSMPTTARRWPRPAPGRAARAPPGEPAVPARRARRRQPQGGGRARGRDAGTAAAAPASRSSRARCAARSGPDSSPQPPGVGERREDGGADRPVAQRPGRGRAGPGRRLLGPGAGRLDQLVVAHPGRAGGHAGHAAQAAVEVGWSPPR